MRQSLHSCRCELALPYHHDPPPEAPQLALRPLIPAAVTLQFLPPPNGPALRKPAAVRAVVSMPEATADENDRPTGGKHEVGQTGQVANVETVAVAQAVDEPADDHLGLGILGPHQ